MHGGVSRKDIELVEPVNDVEGRAVDFGHLLRGIIVVRKGPVVILIGVNVNLVEMISKEEIYFDEVFTFVFRIGLLLFHRRNCKQVSVLVSANLDVALFDYIDAVAAEDVS